MATSLNVGFRNNINVMQIRSSATSAMRVTDRTIDFNNDGSKEVSLGTDPPTPSGVARTIIATEIETDGGFVNDQRSASEYTTGII